jgi:hypothetical protein
MVATGLPRRSSNPSQLIQLRSAIEHSNAYSRPGRLLIFWYDWPCIDFFLDGPMSYFALVKPNDGKPFAIRHCHVNLWSLPGLIRRKMYFDVGFHIAAIEEAVKKVDIALPFAAERLMDISSPLYSREISQLIFRNESINGRISFANAKNLQIVAINEEESKVEEKSKLDKKQERNRSLWHLSIPEIPMGEERYFRVRFEIRNCGRMWNGKRHLLLNYGALLDFRVADTREVPGDPVWDSTRTRIVPLDDLNFFVIAPLKLQMQSASPPLYTSRVLEGDSWEPYLRRRTRGERMIIYQWNKDSPRGRDAISISNPYRVFLDLSREAVSVSIPATIQSAIVIFTMFSVMACLIWWELARVDVNSIRAMGIRLFGGLTIMGLLTWLVAKVEFAKKAALKAFWVLERLDEWAFDRR